MPLPEPPYKVIQQEERARWNPDSSITKLLHVRFMVGTFGPFSHDFELDTFTPDGRDRMLRELAQRYWTE